MPRHRRRRRGKPLTYKQAKAVNKIAVKAMHREAELKCIDYLATGLTGANTTSANAIVTMPSQGTADDERIGDSIYLKSVQLRGDIDCGNRTSTHARVLVVQSLESDLDGDLVLQDVLQSPESDNHLTSFYQCKPSRKFKVLSDRHYYWNANAVATPQPWDLTLKNFGMRKLTLDNTGESGNIGKIHIWVCGDANDDVDLRDSYVRVRYFDN